MAHERGTCPACGGTFALSNRSHTIRLHRARDTEGRIIPGYCRGTDKQPVQKDQT